MSREMHGFYPDYNVLDHADQWDELTRETVLQRLNPPVVLSHLNAWEQKMIAKISEHLVYDDRGEIMAWIVSYFDTQLAADIGESERKPDTPPQNQLIRDGLRAFDHWARMISGQGFLENGTQIQFQILSQLQLGSLPVFDQWQASLQKSLFTKLAGMVIKAYYSHPTVWSEIGYGGPAYPRGYVRIELGLADPWEAKSEEGCNGKPGSGEASLRPL